MIRIRFVSLVLLFSFITLTAFTASAQMPRERVLSAQPAEELFWAPSVIIQPSSTQINRGNLDFTIQHAFGLLSGGVKSLYGLDDPANIRFGLDYGVNDRIAVGVGRSRYNKTFDWRTKVLLRGSSQLKVNAFSNVAIETVEDGRDLDQRLSYYTGLILSRKISGRLFVQVMPAWSHFNLVEINDFLDGSIEEESNDHMVLGVAMRYQHSNRVSVLVDYLPVFGDRSDNTNNVLSFGLDLEAGGHVFQMFFSTTQWITPQHAVSKSKRSITSRDFGFGFNVHRRFSGPSRN